MDATDFTVVSRATLPKTFVGLCFNSDGTKLYASGAVKGVIYEFAFHAGYLSERKTIQIVDVKEKQVPAGIAISRDDKLLFVACPWGGSVALVPLADPTQERLIALDADDYPYSVLPDAENDAEKEEEIEEEERERAERAGTE